MTRRYGLSFRCEENKYYFLFSRLDNAWYLRMQPGFTHVSLIRVHGKRWMIFEPLLRCCFLNICKANEYHRFKNYVVLEVKVKVTKRNRLIRPIFQTCATFVQYIAGISTGAILCQTLYDRLLNCKLEGVEVKKWEPKQQAQRSQGVQH